MGDSNLFLGERVELLDGIIVSMNPQKSRHASAVHRIFYALVPLLGSEAYIRMQAPIVLDDQSEPEPDIAICIPQSSHYLENHPVSREVLQVIEVADASLPYDRGEKACAYAASNIPIYWVVNLVDGLIEVHTNPDPSGRRYAQSRLVRHGDRLDLPRGRQLSVDDVLPPDDR